MLKKILMVSLIISLLILGRTLWMRSIDTTMALDQMTSRSDVYIESHIVTQNIWDLSILLAGAAGTLWIFSGKKKES